MAERGYVRRCDLQFRERIRVPRPGSAELCLRLPEPGHRCLYRHEPVSWQPNRGASWEDRYASNTYQLQSLCSEKGREKGLRTLSTSTRSPSLSGSSLRPGRTGANPSESSWEQVRVFDQRPGELREGQSCREVARRRGSSQRLYAPPESTKIDDDQLFKSFGRSIESCRARYALRTCMADDEIGLPHLFLQVVREPQDAQLQTLW